MNNVRNYAGLLVWGGSVFVSGGQEQGHFFPVSFSPLVQVARLADALMFAGRCARTY
jgi:hypothetical protein